MPFYPTSGIFRVCHTGILRISLKYRWLAGIILLTLAAFLVLRGYRKTEIERYVRIGVDQSPPFYLIAPDGSVSGLGIDVLNEAARRRGIEIAWVPLHDIPLDDALKRRVVQMWPLVGVTAERSRNLFLTKPWLESDYVLVSRKERPVRNADEAAGLTVSHARLRLTTMLANQFLPRSKRLIRLYREDAVQAVCKGEAEASLVESRVLDAILLTRPKGCESVDFNISTLPGATSPLAIAAVPEMKGTAVELRDEIAHLTQDGFLSAKLDQWSPFSAEGTRSIWAEEAANQRSQIYRYSLLVIAVFATVLAWVARRAWRLKRLAEHAESALRETQRRFTAFMDNSPAVSFMKDSEGRLLYVNKAWSNMFGRSPEQCYGQTDFSLWPADVAHQLRATDIELMAGNDSRQWIEQVPVAANDTRALLTVKFPFASEKGEMFVGGTGIDITEREKAIRQLAESESRYRELFEQNPLPAWVCDRETMLFLNVNQAALKHYGWTREDFLTGMRLHDIVADKSARHMTKDGRLLNVDVTAYELEYEGRPGRLMIVRDVTDQQRMLEQLRMSEERWQLALRGAGDALWDWDLTTGLVFRSARWATMLGYEEDEVGDTREDLLRLLHPEDLFTVQFAVEEHLARRVPTFSVEYRLRHKDGTWRWIMDRGQAVWDERGAAIRMAGSHTDVTDRRAAQELLAREARTDALTGLLNRREFGNRFNAQIKDARAATGKLCVCICDLDRFKEVNDSFGHAVGDKVLIAFGEILKRNVRKTDLIARVGGDEFLVSLPNTGADEARFIVERMREELHQAEFTADGVRFHVSSSFGVAELHGPHRDGADLIAEADRLLYGAKDGGRNRTMAA